MRQQTVLILDSQQHRGSMLERGLSGRGYHVFRTSRSREANKLLHILQPHFVVLAWEGEGRDFYQQVVWEGQLGTSRCVVLTAPSSATFRDTDVIVDVRLSSAQLLDDIVRAFSAPTGTTTPWNRTPGAKDDRTVLAMQAVPPSAAGFSLSHGLEELEQWDPYAPTPSVPVSSQLRQPPLATVALQPLDVARSLAMLAREQATGRIEIQTQKEKCWIVLERGMVVMVQAAHPIFSFPAWLMQTGVLSQQDAILMTELAMPGAPQRLLALQRISTEQVPFMEQMYAEQCILSCFPWTQGQFQFFPGEGLQAEKTLSLSLASLVLQGVRQGYSRERLMELVGKYSQVPQWFASHSPEKFLQFGEVEKKILAQIDSYRNLDQIKTSVACSTEVFLSVVYVLVILGFLRLRDNEAGTSPVGTGRLESFSVKGPMLNPESVVGKEAPVSRDPRATAPPPSHRSSVSVVTPGISAEPSLPATEPRGSSVSPPSMSFRSHVGTARPGTMQMRAFSPQVPISTAVPTGPMSPEPAPGMGLGLSERESIDQKFHQILLSDYFQILEVSLEANDGEIRRSYQQLKHTFARERFANPLAATTEEQLQEIRQVLEEAYTVLSDPPLRHRYVAHLAQRG